MSLLILALYNGSAPYLKTLPNLGFNHYYGNLRHLLRPAILIRRTNFDTFSYAHERISNCNTLPNFI